MKPIFKGRKENLHSLKSRRKTARVTKYNRNKKIPVSTSQTLDEKVMGFLNSVIKTYGKDSAVKIKIPSLSNTSKQRKRKLLKSVRWVFFEQFTVMQHAIIKQFSALFEAKMSDPKIDFREDLIELLF